MCKLSDTLPVAEMASNIVRAYREAESSMDADTFRAAFRWYETAHETVKGLAADNGVPFPVALWLTAYFSQNAAWNVNVDTVGRFVRAYRTGNVDGATMYATKRMRKIAAQVVSGTLAPVADNLTGVNSRAMKVPSFFANIGSPLTSQAVTVDRHAARIAVGSDAVSVPTGGAYTKIAEAYRQAAAILGVLPSQAQAVTWTARVGDLP